MNIIKQIKDKYSSIFDFEDDFTIGNYKFNLYARYKQENAKCFISPATKIYSYTNNEHIFLKDDANSDIDFEELKKFFMYVYKDFIKVDSNHMSSTITVIYIASKIDDITERQIKKFKFDKSYCFGFKGFVKGKLIVFDPSTNKAYENKLALGDAKKMGFFA